MTKPDPSTLVRSIAIAFATRLLLGMPAMAQQAAPAPAGAASAPAGGAGSTPVAPAAPADAASATPAAGAATQAAPTDEGSNALETVLVTARRTKEKLQDVPTAVTAIGVKEIEDLQITGFGSVAKTVPNLFIQKQAGSPATAQIQIRGISNGSLNQQVDSGIGLYVDGVYFGRPGASAFDLADLERVEVLRGPQGTLFGRNSTGGAINMITALPTGELGGSLTLGYGNYNDQLAKFTFNTPDYNGLAARITLGYHSLEGDVKNTSPKYNFAFNGPLGPYSSLTTNERGGDSETSAVLFALSYTGLKDLKVYYKYDYTDWKGTMDYRQSGNISSTGVVTGFDYQSELFMPLEGTATNKVHGQSLIVQYALTDQISLQYVGGWRGYDLNVPGNQVFGEAMTTDLGGGNIGTALFAKRAESQDQYSNELQLIGTTGPVDWIAGLFQFKETGSVNGPILFGTAFGGAPIGPTNVIDPAAGNYFLGQDTNVTNKSSAAYAHATWHIDNQWDLAGGLRYTRDDRSEEVIAGGLVGLAIPSPLNSSYEGSNTDTDLSLTYKFTPEANAYFKYATGYVSGGTLLGTVFDPEFMTAYELGFKSELLDRRLRLNMDVFYQERKDAQIEYFNSATGGYLMGKADSTSTGFEIETTWKADKNLTLSGAYGYTHVSSSGDLRVTQPVQNAYVGGEYKFDRWSNGIVPRVRLDLGWHSAYYTMRCPAGTAQDPGADTCSGTVVPALDAATQIPSSFQLSGLIALASIPMWGQTTGQLSLWGQNLLNNKEPQYNFSLGGTAVATTYTRPLTVGLQFVMDF